MNRGVLDPSLLWNVCHTTPGVDKTGFLKILQRKITTFWSCLFEIHCGLPLPFSLSLSLYRSQKVVSKEGQAALMLLCYCFHTFSISPSKAESRDDLPAPTVPTTAMRAPSLTDMLMSFKVGLLALSHLG